MSLPLELATAILACLDVHSILVCRQVCRLLHSLIASSSELQYCIALARAGQIDNPRSNITHITRLDILSRYISAWNNLDWSQDQLIDMQNGGLWELFGDVLAQYTAAKTFHFTQLPSHIRSIQQCTHVLTLPDDINLRDFSMDPSQDLLVLAENPRWLQGDRLYRVHLRTISTGLPHPLAHKPAVLVHRQDHIDHSISYAIQISSDHVGLLFISSGEDNTNELCIWNWKTAVMKLNIIGDGIRAFSFLNERYIISAGLYEERDRPFQDTPILAVLSYEESWSQPQKPHINEAPYICLFSFPELHQRASAFEISIRSDPSPGWSPHPSLHVPFSADTESKLYVITLWVFIGIHVQGVNLFVPASTFLRHIRNLHLTRVSIDWNAWGPDGSRMMTSSLQTSNVWVCYVYGSRFVGTYPSRVLNEYAVSVYDFNQRAIAGAQQDNSGTNMIIDNPSVLKTNEEIFKEDIRTSLPYRHSFRPIGTERQYAMCGADNLVLVDTSERCYRLLTF